MLLCQSRRSAQEAQIAGPVKVDTESILTQALAPGLVESRGAPSVCRPTTSTSALRGLLLRCTSWHDGGGEGGRSV